ncbi:MAG TPA: NUDIX hydrolase [Bacteroidales bacterium]|nr:NUDIX hydrolase [Bacteroidales bacterium]
MNLNPHISVDCVIFGFSEGTLKVLLIEREKVKGHQLRGHRLKLPGSLISEQEDLDTSATRTLTELTGLKDIFLKQYAVFGDPQRLKPPEDLEWLRRTSGVKVDRVVTVAYYSLIKISDSAITEKTIWHPVDKLPELIFDHNHIVMEALLNLRNEFRDKPLCFELLPKKFTLRQLQDIFESILNITLDSRNFRKKIRKLNYLTALPEKEKNVNHKPAKLYKFDRHRYEKKETPLI